MRKHQVQALLMGGQACVFYGAAQFSKDVDFVLLAGPENYSRLLEALDELSAKCIAVELVGRFPMQAKALEDARPLLAHARSGNLGLLRSALDAEVRAEQAKDRAYWEPLKREMEAFRREERD